IRKPHVAGSIPGCSEGTRGRFEEAKPILMRNFAASGLPMGELERAGRLRVACRVLKMHGSTHSPEKRRLFIEQGGLRVEKVSAWTTAWPFRPTRARCVTSSGAASLHPTRTTAPSFSARSGAAGGKQGGRSTRGAAAHLRGRRLAGRPRGVLA